MEYQGMDIVLNKEKSIGKVLFIVEGGRTEPYILRKIFTTIFDYQMETIIRDKKYSKYNSKENPTSQVFVINAEESNIKFIQKDNEFLNKIFVELIENYDFDVDNAAIYYLFDRDNKSNTNVGFMRNLVSVLTNARDNDSFDRQGMLLLSYPSIESFTVSNFGKDTFSKYVDTGHNLKLIAHQNDYNNQNITDDTLAFATKELLRALMEIEHKQFDIDKFSDTSKEVFEYEEMCFCEKGLYRVLSLFAVSLIDLGLVEIYI
jgi:hypothetical protein